MSCSCGFFWVEQDSAIRGFFALFDMQKSEED